MKLEKIKSLSEVENEIKQLKNATFSIFLHLFEKIVKSANFSGISYFIYWNRSKKFQQNLRGSPWDHLLS